MKPPPPLRFLALVVGGWICIRAAILVPGWWGEVAPIPRRVAAATAPAAVAPRAIGAAPAPASDATFARRLDEPRHARPASALPPRVFAPSRQAASPEVALLPAAPAEPDRAGLFARPPPISTAARRWSGAAWLLVRDDRGAPALAPGGTLGGSQAGARLLFRLGGGLALTGRFYLPLRRSAGAEAAAGLDWRPSERLPLRLLAERRQALGREGRSAFALTLYGGGGADLPRGLRLEAYGQAGIVGTRSRDLFADGAVRVSARLGPVEIGGGAWGAAQPGAARLDAGPQLSYRLPARSAALRLLADWRLRVAGDAAPGSGPALTLAADF